MNAALKIADQKAPAVTCSPEFALAMGRALTDDWDLLVLVPTQTDGLDLFASELERLSLSRAFESLRVVDARGLPADTRPELLAKLLSSNRSVVLVDPPEHSVLATLMCSDADALLLLVRQDQTRIDDARALIERCGREKFLGSFLLTGAGR